MSNQRAGKTHAATLRDNDTITLRALVQFCDAARKDLYKAGDQDAALRFEILTEYLRNDFKGGFTYNSKMIGL
jgi:hypothetical protein